MFGLLYLNFTPSRGSHTFEVAEIGARQRGLMYSVSLSDARAQGVPCAECRAQSTAHGAYPKYGLFTWPNVLIHKGKRNDIRSRAD